MEPSYPTEDLREDESGDVATIDRVVPYILYSFDYPVQAPFYRFLVSLSNYSDLHKPTC